MKCLQCDESVPKGRSKYCSTECNLLFVAGKYKDRYKSIRSYKNMATKSKSTCLFCGCIFYSWDVRYNRRCKKCLSNARGVLDTHEVAIKPVRG